MDNVQNCDTYIDLRSSKPVDLIDKILHENKNNVFP
jgi:hypothetical protein